MDSSLFAIRLHEARLMMRLSMEQLSEKTSRTVTKQSISKYEKGQMKPKKGTLDALSVALDISPQYFSGTNMKINTPMLRNAFKKELPSEEDMKRIESQLAFWSEQYIEAEKKAKMEIQFVNPISDRLIATIDDACRAADDLRQAWNCGDGPIPSVLRLMERKGIKILDKHLPLGVLGMSTWADNRYPLIIIDMANEKHTVERLRFTAAHELGHIMLNIPEEIEGQEKEKLCEQFAGYFLLPKSTLIEELGSDKRQSVTIEELIDLHEVYGVSIAALIHELWDFRIISREQYDWWYDERIKKNCKEVGWGQYLFPETIGREKRTKSIIDKI